MKSTHQDLSVPEFTWIAGEVDDVIYQLANNVKLLTGTINTIRQNQEILLNKYIPDLINGHNLLVKNQDGMKVSIKEIQDQLNDKSCGLLSLNTKLDKANENIGFLDNKVNNLTFQTNEIVTQLMVLAETFKNSQLEQQQNSQQITQPRPLTSKSLSVKYCECEIPDDELRSYTKDELKKLRQNIYSAISRYKNAGKHDQIAMSQINLDKINKMLQ